MISEDTKILEFNQHQKSDKAAFRYLCRCWLKRYNKTTKVRKHIPSGFSMSTISSFRSTENKHDVYRGKDFMKKFYESLTGNENNNFF